MAANGRLPASALASIPGGRLEHNAAKAWNAMCAEARARHNVEIRPAGPRSSYRTFAEQQHFWNLYISGRGNLAARPGTSNHGLGLAVDLADGGRGAMRRVIDQIGSRYGWAKKWSDAAHEPWHLKFRAGVWDGRGHEPTQEEQWRASRERRRDALRRVLARRAQLRRDKKTGTAVYRETTGQMSGLRRTIATLTRLIGRKP